MESATNEYDFNSAVTFLLVGLGIGSVLAIVFKPKQGVALGAAKDANEWRTDGLQPQEEARD